MASVKKSKKKSVTKPPCRLASAFTAKFSCKESELCFVQSRSERLSVNLSYALAALGAVTVFTIVVPWHDGVQFATEAGNSMVHAHAIGKIMISSALFLVAAFLRLNLRMKCVGPVAIELISSMMICFATVQVLFSRPYHVAKFYGYDPAVIYRLETGEELQEPCQAATSCLMIDSILTIAHLALPVRSYLFLPPDVTGMVVAILCIVHGPENEKSTALILLVCIGGLILFAFLGSRTLEVAQRQSFLALLEEKCRRVETEFKLEVFKEQSERKRDDVSSEGTLATAQTTSTARIFDLDPIPEDSEPGLTLEDRLIHLAQLGKQHRWLIDSGEIELLPAVLGFGSFGLVVKGSYAGTSVAVKIPGGALPEPKLNEMGNELGILRHLRHPNIVTFHGACVVPELGQLALMLELVQGPPLDEFVMEEELEDVQRKELLVGICSALRYLHSRSPRVVHGDVKGSNILVERTAEGLRPKLLDFGLSRNVTKHAKPLGGTMRYIAPEVLAGAPPRCASDIFSFGRLTFVVLTGSCPLQDYSETEVRELSLNCSPALDWPAELIASPQHDIACRCLEFDSALRPSMPEVQEVLVTRLKPVDDVADDWSTDWQDAYPKLREWASSRNADREKKKHRQRRETSLYRRLRQLIQEVKEDDAMEVNSEGGSESPEAGTLPSTTTLELDLDGALPERPLSL